MPHGQLYLFSFTPLRRQRHACPLTETWAFWLRAIKRTTDTRIAIRTNGEYYILLWHSTPVSEAIVKYVITKEVTIHNLTSKGKAPLLIQVGHNAGNKRKRPGAQSSGAGAGADSNVKWQRFRRARRYKQLRQRQLCKRQRHGGGRRCRRERPCIPGPVPRPLTPG